MFSLKLNVLYIYNNKTCKSVTGQGGGIIHIKEVALKRLNMYYRSLFCPLLHWCPSSYRGGFFEKIKKLIIYPYLIRFGGGGNFCINKALVSVADHWNVSKYLMSKPDIDIRRRRRKRRRRKRRRRKRRRRRTAVNIKDV